MLRSAGLMHIGVPFAVAALTFALAYIVFPASIPWYSPLAMSALVVMAAMEFLVLLGIARVAQRFDKRE
jgi:hypothetical protein